MRVGSSRFPSTKKEEEKEEREEKRKERKRPPLRRGIRYSRICVPISEDRKIKSCKPSAPTNARYMYVSMNHANKLKLERTSRREILFFFPMHLAVDSAD